MKIWQAIVFALVTGVVSTAISSHAQEKDPSYPQTRQWQLGQLYSNGRYDSGAVVVFDTAGVCLYVVTSRLDGVSVIKGGSVGNIHAIAAVPKTQLPKGTGCQ